MTALTRTTECNVSEPRAQSRAARAVTRPPPRRDDGAVPHDLRFRTLLGAAAWSRLPEAIRDRFARRADAGAAVTYVGEIVESHRHWSGVLLAQICRLIGAPLPLGNDIGVPAVVTVTEDAAGGGQFWTRMYGRSRGFPQVIHSSKRFAGPTGLEEYLGLGVGIALSADADHAALHFTSAYYFIRVGGARLRLPRWLAPGTLTVSHVDRGGGRFAFVLALEHPLFGIIIHQTGLFSERLATQPADVDPARSDAGASDVGPSRWRDILTHGPRTR